MTLSLYNTLTRQKEEFKPINPDRVTMYACGPTVYNYIHIGNARMITVFDMLYRVLKHRYKHVVYARNVTDIDDRIIDTARAENVTTDVIAQRYTKAFFEDLQGLGTLTPDFQPLATDYIPEMIAMVERLIDNGHAYAAEDHVLFSVPSYKDYGSLARRNRDEQIAGARVDVAPYKRDPADFVLWKPSIDDQPGWDSPWGFGRPGWHLECSAMSTEILGHDFDIHGGGLDLTFPHHENEIAQSCCTYQSSSFARVWMHNGFINVDNEKMSKSLGNFHFLRDILTRFPGEAVRFALLGAHYRQPLEFNLDLLTEAKKTLDRWYQALEKHADHPATQPTNAFMSAVEDDLNTPLAFAELHRLINEINRSDSAASLVGEFKACTGVLGLMQQSAEEWFKIADDKAVIVQDLIARRLEARNRRDFAEADRIRVEIEGMGILLFDEPAGGTSWRRG